MERIFKIILLRLICLFTQIYGSELERQPEFSKFRDWCSALKLYYNNSNRYGKVKQQFCGHIKVGLAIYRWPPPGDSIPVSQSGVELNKGYKIYNTLLVLIAS